MFSHLVAYATNIPWAVLSSVLCWYIPCLLYVVFLLVFFLYTSGTLSVPITLYLKDLNLSLVY